MPEIKNTWIHQSNHYWNRDTNNEMENQSTNPPDTVNSQYLQQNTLIAGKNGKYSM